MKYKSNLKALGLALRRVGCIMSGKMSTFDAGTLREDVVFCRISYGNLFAPYQLPKSTFSDHWNDCFGWKRANHSH